MGSSADTLQAAQWHLFIIVLVLAAPVVTPVAAHSSGPTPTAATTAGGTDALPGPASSVDPATVPETALATATTPGTSTATPGHLLGATATPASPTTAVAATTTAAADPPIMAFAAADTDTLTTYDTAGETTDLGVSTAVSGPLHDIDGDGTLEAVYVDDSGQLNLVDERGETEALAATNAPTSKTMFAVGDMDGDGTLAVFYPNSAESNSLYKLEYGEQPTQVTPTAAKAVLGVTDYDDDGDTDVVFLDGSNTIKFYDGSLESTGYSSIGSNNGIGVGAPADFDGDGVSRVPVVDGSNNPALIAADGSRTVLKTGSALKAPIAGVDITGDQQLEVVHVNKDGKLAYTTLADSTATVTTADGSAISAVKKVGVVAAGSPPPAVSEYTVTNPDGQDVRINFNATQELTDIELAMTRNGETVATLTEANFTASPNADGFQYAATYTVATDGDYTATLERAADSDGDTASATPSGTVSVTVPPTISDYTVTNPTASDILVSVNSSEQLREISVAVDGPTTRTLTAANFTETTTATGAQYQARVTVSEGGTYTTTLQTATDAAGTDGADGQTRSVIINAPDSRVVDAAIVDLDDGNGIVSDGSRVRITATVRGASVRQVTSNLSALGAGTVTLTQADGDRYQTTAVVTASDAAQAESVTFTVRAADSTGTVGTRQTEPLSVDTVPPSANTGPDVRVRKDTKVVFDATASTDNIAIAGYSWRFGDDTRGSGEAVVHVYEEPGTYTVRLTTVDTAGNRNTATRTITVTDVPDDPTGTPVTTPTDGEPARVVEVVRIDDDSDTTTTATNGTVAETSRFQNGTVGQIQFREQPPAGTLRVERLASLPSDVPEYPGTVIWPLEITLSSETAVPARVVFSLDRDRLGETSPAQVTLLRYADGSWQQLSTSVVTRGPQAVGFAAETPGFSYFAVAVPPQEDATAPGTPATPTATPDAAEPTATPDAAEPTATPDAAEPAQSEMIGSEPTTEGSAGGHSAPLWPWVVGVIVLLLAGVGGYWRGYFDG